MSVRRTRFVFLISALFASIAMMIVPTLSQAAPKHLVTVFFTKVDAKLDGDPGADCGDFFSLQVSGPSDTFTDFDLDVPQGDFDGTEKLCTGDSVTMKVLDMSNTLQFQAEPNTKLSFNTMAFELDQDLEDTAVLTGFDSFLAPQPNTWKAFTMRVVDKFPSPTTELVFSGVAQTSKLPASPSSNSNAKLKLKTW